jgi:hypothetical protein
MTTDVRPPGLNLKFRPGTTITFTITGWGDGELADRTFEALLGEDTLDLTVDDTDSIMTIVVTDTITDNYPNTVVDFFLNEDIDGTMEPIIIGRWTPSLKARETVSSDQSFEVSIGAVSVTVNLSGAAVISGHLATRVFESGGVHGVVLHRWDRDGWEPFEDHIVNTDTAGAQTFTRTVNGRRGRFTGSVSGSATVTGPGNLREFSVRPDTNFADSEIKSLWFGPNRFSLANQTPTRRPQMGHVHRFQESGGFVRGIVCWYNIFLGPNPEVLNLNLWEGEGDDTALVQGSGGTGGSNAMVDRAGLIGYAARIDAFNVSQHRVTPGSVVTAIPAGATGSITGMTDTTFNDPSTLTISSGSRSGGTSTINTSTSHGLTTGDWVLVDGTDNSYDGLWQVTVTDSDTFTFLQQAADDAAVGGGTVVKRWVVNDNQPANGLLQVADTVANNNVDKTAGGFWVPDYPWKVFPYWVASRLIGNTLYAKQWAFGNSEPDWGDAKAVASAAISQGSAAGFPTGPGLCGIVLAHAHDNDYAEYGDIEFRKL